MRLLAIGDIHGCYHALMALLEVANFQKGDRLITLGDYVDRGPQSADVLDWIIQRSLRGDCVPLRGNHEIMMLSALQGRQQVVPWLQFGGQETLESYSGRDQAGTVSGVPLEHLQFLDYGLQPYFETDDFIFVHAAVKPNLPLRQQPEETLYWARFEEMEPHASGKTVVCGHTAQKSGVPLDEDFAICIDTYAYGGGWLTCLDMETFQYWQANEHGETRQGWLRGERQ